jgi:hypothetical protein
LGVGFPGRVSKAPLDWSGPILFGSHEALQWRRKTWGHLNIDHFQYSHAEYGGAEEIVSSFYCSYPSTNPRLHPRKAKPVM